MLLQINSTENFHVVIEGFIKFAEKRRENGAQRVISAAIKCAHDL